MLEAIFRFVDPSAWHLAELGTGAAATALIMGAFGLGIYHWVRSDRQRLITALNNMSQGLCMFDANARLRLCNDRYIEMYAMSPAVVTPGCSLRKILQHRIVTGSFTGDPDQYIAKIFNELASAKQTTKVVQLPDGRKIALTERPMPDGGWVVTHDDVTEQSRVDQQQAALRINEERRSIIESAISDFREQIQTVFRTVGENATAMKSNALALVGTSSETSHHVEGAVCASKEASTNVANAAGAADELSGSIAEIRDRKSTRLNSSHIQKSRMPSSA